MAPWIIWTSAVLAYLLFRGWYDNWSGPLSPAEIDSFLAAVDGLPHRADTDPTALRAFLEADDGREFWMINLVQVESGPVADPVSGHPVPGRELFQRYARFFIPLLLRHGGHPVLAGRKVGAYIDAWKVAPDPGWTFSSVMRYRSRRDLLRIALHPAFQAAHPLKPLGTAATFSFPAQPMLSLYPGPRVSVGLVLALLAALAHLFYLTR